MTRKFYITTADKHELDFTQHEYTFNRFITYLKDNITTKTLRGNETKEEINRIKNTYNFTTSKIEGRKSNDRTNENVKAISMLKLDIDKSDIEETDIKSRLDKLDIDYVLYTTFSHKVKGNCHRVIIPLAEDIKGTTEEMKAILKAITISLASELEVIEYLDSASYKISQIMYCPTYRKGINEGKIISRSEGNFLDITSRINIDDVLTHSVSSEEETSIDIENIEELEGTGNRFTTDEIIKRIQTSEQADIFKKLFLGEGLDLENEDRNRLDMTLCDILAFWTNRDIKKMDKLFRQSKLMRNKWDSKRRQSTYGRDTLIKAIKQLGNDGLKDWVIVNSKTGSKKLLTGVLADHLAKSVKSKYSANRFYLYKDGVYTECEQQEEQTLVKKYIPLDLTTTASLYDVVHQWSVCEGMRVSANDWNNDNFKLNLKNGIYDIKEKQLIPHDPSYLSTVRINANYNPTATGIEWDKFIKRVVPNETYRKIVQEILGYSLTTFNNIKKMFILDGESNTGKSVYLNTIQHLLGDRNVSNIELQTLSDRFNKVHLYGKVANIFGDLPTTPIKENIFKALTGDDSINAERKGQEGFSFRSKAKLLFSCNGLPSNYGDTSSAFYNRLMIIPFDEVIPSNEQDPLLKEKLQAESDYILSWGLEGLHRLIDNDFKFTHCEDMEKRVQEYRKEGNVVMQFLEEDCIISDDGDNVKHIPVADLYPLYESYCEREKHKHILGKQNFNKEMRRLGHKAKRHGSKECWINIYPKHWIAENEIKKSNDPIDINTRKVK